MMYSDPPPRPPQPVCIYTYIQAGLGEGTEVREEKKMIAPRAILAYSIMAKRTQMGGRAGRQK